MAIAARIAMIATTIISSIRVKPFWFFMVYPLGLWVAHVHWRQRSSPSVLGRRVRAMGTLHHPCQQIQTDRFVRRVTRIPLNRQQKWTSVTLFPGPAIVASESDVAGQRLPRP